MLIKLILFYGSIFLVFNLLNAKSLESLEYLNNVTTTIRTKRHITTSLELNNSTMTTMLNTTMLNIKNRRKRGITITAEIPKQKPEPMISKKKRSPEIFAEHSNLITNMRKFFENLTPEQKKGLNEIKSNTTLTRAQIEEQIDQWANKQPENIKVI